MRNFQFSGDKELHRGAHEQITATLERILHFQEMLTSLQGFANDNEQEQASSTIVVVLSHGNVQGLIGTADTALITLKRNELRDEFPRLNRKNKIIHFRLLSMSFRTILELLVRFKFLRQ